MAHKNERHKDHLNIAMLGHKRVPSREGGVEVVVTELSVRLSREGHHVTCYNRRGSFFRKKKSEEEYIEEYQGVRLKYVPTINFKGISAFTSSLFAALCCALGNYDVVHFHAEGPSAMCWLPHLFGKKVIVTIHGLDHQREKWGVFARKFIEVGEKMAVRYADEIIVLSRNTQQYFEERYGRATHYIPNGVTRPNPRKANVIRTRWNLEKDSYFLFLGRIVPEKGLESLIRAFLQVKSDKKLVIAGASSDTDSFMEKLKKLASQDERILFIGHVQDEALEELYSNAYVYVLPSELEGMPLSLLEAMSYGNCCVVSDIPECTEVVEDKALTVRKGDVRSLQNTLQMLVDHKDTVNRYRKDAADFICSRYHWDDAVNETLKLYKGEATEETTGRESSLVENTIQVKSLEKANPVVQQKKKILFIVEAMGGGVFTYIVDLSNQLVDSYEMHIAYATRKQTPKDFERYFDQRIHLHHVKNFERTLNPVKDIRAFFEIRKIAELVQPDIIHLHASIAGALGRFAFNGKKIVLFYTPHGYSFLKENYDPLRRGFFHAVEAICGKRNCTTISCSKGEHQESVKLNKQAVYVSNGINVEEIDEFLKNDVKVHHSLNEEENFTVFTIGRICYQKNPSMFNRIAKSLPDLSFVWIGDGELREELDSPNIQITGWLEREDAIRMAAGYHLFILPSLWEGLPMSLLESMYLKKICLVSNVIGNRDVIQNGVNGFICGSHDEYVSMIRSVRGKDPKLEEKIPGMIEHAYQDVLSTYNTKIMAQSYMKIYQEKLSWMEEQNKIAKE